MGLLPVHEANNHHARSGRCQHAYYRIINKSTYSLSGAAASAAKSIYITTPYYLPDKSARKELIRAKKERNVDIKSLCPGTKSIMR